MESKKLEFEREKWISSQWLKDKKVEVQAGTASFERQKWLGQKYLDEKRIEIDYKIFMKKLQGFHSLLLVLPMGSPLKIWREYLKCLVFNKSFTNSSCIEIKF